MNSSKRIAKKLYSLQHQYLDNFVFIHINKTGGSSVEKALKIPFEHKTALEKIDELGYDNWLKKFTFTVVRNPWDKVVSHYQYRVQTNQTDLGGNSLGFKDWLRLAYGEKNPLYYDKPKMFMPQSDWISDQEGRILVDHVCRFENLSDDFDYVCKKLKKSVKLPHLKASKRGCYRDYYDDAAAEIVAHYFSNDIEQFGYRF
jgi:chondroitin 4-sulfotransferase 11